MTTADPADIAIGRLRPMSLKAHPCPRRARSALGRGRNGRWIPAPRLDDVSNIPLAGITPSEIFDLCLGGQDGCAFCPRAGTASAKPSPITAPH